MKLIDEIRQDKREIMFEFKRSYDRRDKYILWSDYEYLCDRILETIAKTKETQGFINRLISAKIRHDLQSLFLKLDIIDKIRKEEV